MSTGPVLLPQAVVGFWRVLQPRTKKRMGLLVAASLFSSISEAAAAGAVSLLGLILASPQTVHSSVLFSKLALLWPYLDSLTHQPAKMLALCLVLIVASVAFKSLIACATVWGQSFVSQHCGRDVACAVFSEFLTKPYSWHIKKNTAELHTELGWANMVSGYFMALLTVAISGATVLLLLATSLAVSPVSAVIVFAFTALVGGLAVRCVRRRIRQASSLVANIDRNIARTTLSALQGILEVTIYKQQQPFLSEFKEKSKDKPKRQASAQMFSTVPAYALEVIGMGMLLVSHIFLMSLGYPLDELVLSISLLAGVSWRLLPALNKIAAAMGSIQIYTPYVTTLGGYLPSDEPQDLPESCGLENFNFLELQHVTFRYEGAKEDALKKLSATIQRGSMIGFIGRSGAGKSTLVGILTGLMRPASGNFLIDGKEYAPRSGGCWSSAIGYVPQTTYLLDATLAENIAFGDYGKKIDREHVLKCCEMASINFVDELENGIDTVLGERGVRLSGGQKQRVAIARALYKNPQLIIFDEATSALDSAAEQAIQKTILSLRDTATLVVIAHRLSTVEGCDYLYWLDGGEVRLSGVPDVVLPQYKEWLDEI